jgi:hypothetical protein
MGCFSGDLDARATKMFARLDGVGNQYIVYSVEYASATETAVIFPLPMALGDASVQFVSLEGYDDFFHDLASGFVTPTAGRWMQYRSDFGDGLSAPWVRAVDAVYVPTIDELRHLDASMRPADEIWEKLPHYRDFGFVVVKLPSTAVSVAAQVACAAAFAGSDSMGGPMEMTGHAVVERVRLRPFAFRFASREPRCVFYPMLTATDGEVKPVVEFDHTLYLQHDKLGNDFAQHHVGHVSLRASNFMRAGDAGVTCPRSCCFRKIIRGQSVNQDLWVYPANAAARITRWVRPR